MHLKEKMYFFLNTHTDIRCKLTFRNGCQNHKILKVSNLSREFFSFRYARHFEGIRDIFICCKTPSTDHFQQKRFRVIGPLDFICNLNEAKN